MPVDNDKIRALAERINGMSCGGTLLKSFGDGGHSGGRGSDPAYSGGGHSGGRSADPRDIAANSTNKYERIGNGRYWMANDSLVRSGSSPDDADRLARILAAQSALEAGWVDDVKGNNFAGYMSNGKRMSFGSPDEFWDYHIMNLDKKWPGWRRADSVKAYYDIVNNTALGLDTKEKFDAYNRAHRDSPAYIYAPAWENSNYLVNLSGVYDRYINKYVPALGKALSDGGKIHIKESHKGRLTELKKRTGKTEAELYNDGNPAHKKMVVFARNARKWHSDGGAINKAFDEGNLDVLKAAINNVLSKKLR